MIQQKLTPVILDFSVPFSQPDFIAQDFIYDYVTDTFVNHSIEYGVHSAVTLFSNPKFVNDFAKEALTDIAFKYEGSKFKLDFNTISFLIPEILRRLVNEFRMVLGDYPLHDGITIETYREMSNGEFMFFISNEIEEDEKNIYFSFQ